MEAATNWLPCRRRHFNCISWIKTLNFEWNFAEICPLGYNWQYCNIGSDNGLAPARRQAIIWSNVVMLYWRIYASLSLNELTGYGETFRIWWKKYDDNQIQYQLVVIFCIISIAYASTICTLSPFQCILHILTQHESDTKTVESF